jgi:hypothetical protein
MTDVSQVPTASIIGSIIALKTPKILFFMLTAVRNRKLSSLSSH